MCEQIAIDYIRVLTTIQLVITFNTYQSETMGIMPCPLQI